MRSDYERTVHCVGVICANTVPSPREEVTASESGCDCRIHLMVPDSVLYQG